MNKNINALLFQMAASDMKNQLERASQKFTIGAVLQSKKPMNANFPEILNDFMCPMQKGLVLQFMKGEEKQYFIEKMAELAKTIEEMPKMGEQDGIVYLHYFKGGADWFIMEKDMGDVDDVKNGVPPQSQAFGLADLFNDGGELGYISIDELKRNNVELDFHWTPKTLEQVRAERN